MTFKLFPFQGVRKLISLCIMYGFVYSIVSLSLLGYAVGQTCTAPSVSIEIGQTCNDVNVQSTTGSTVTNFGTINFNSNNTALFSAFNNDLRIDNQSTGLINGQYVGVSLLLETISSINNLGTIQAVNFSVLNDATSQITNLNNSGTIRNASVGIKNEGLVSQLDNSGSITASIIGVDNWLLTGPRPQIDILNNTGILGSSTGTAISNNGVITTINNSGTLFGSYGIDNDGSISRFNNSGDLLGDNFGIANYDRFGQIINSGTILASLASSVAIQNYTSGTIDLISNTGTISGGSVGISNIGVITNMINSGTIQGAGGDGLSNSGTIIDLTNSGTIRSFGMGGQYGITNSGNISTLSNSGVLSGLASGLNISVGATITTLVNATGGSIGGGGTGISNAGTINTLLNNGQISSAFSAGLFNSGNLSVITNIGQILAPFGDMISNPGEIATLNNLNKGVALTYSGTLPTSYNIIINSPTQYGKLAASAISSAATFGIYAGSTLSKRTYTSVLSGITSSNLNNTSGAFNGFRWNLSNSSSDIWDLIVTGASTADTQQSLVNTASVLQGAFTLQNSVMVNGFTYDCPVFDKHGVCVSVGGRNTTVQAQGINNTNGLLIASYRLNNNNARIGAWVDQNLSMSGPGTVHLNNSTPMVGLFGVWSQRPDGVGAEVKVSAAYGQKDTTITRQVVGTSEAGSGGSQLISQGAQVVGKYGFAVMPDVVVSPYAGVRYTQNNMGGYTEATSSAVTAPLTYSALNTNATTALAGAEARYRGIPKTTLFVSAGVETNTNTANVTYSATGVAGLTPVNFNPNPVKTRPTATVGGYYDILKNQRIGITGIYRQEPFQAVSTTTVLATYTIGL